jgi:hypothetical protein
MNKHEVTLVGGEYHNKIVVIDGNMFALGWFKVSRIPSINLDSVNDHKMDLREDKYEIAPCGRYAVFKELRNE